MPIEGQNDRISLTSSQLNTETELRPSTLGHLAYFCNATWRLSTTETAGKEKGLSENTKTLVGQMKLQFL